MLKVLKHVKYDINEDDKTAIVVGYENNPSSVIIPELIGDARVICINAKAFKGCSSLKEVTIGNNVVMLGESSFADCVNLGKVIFGNKINKICNNAFKDSNLSEVTELPNNLLFIGANAFACTKLKEIHIPETTSFIGNLAFSFCTHLRKLEVKNRYGIIGMDVLTFCNELDEIILGNLHYDVENVKDYKIYNKLLGRDRLNRNTVTSTKKYNPYAILAQLLDFEFGTSYVYFNLLEVNDKQTGLNNLLGLECIKRELLTISVTDTFYNEMASVTIDLDAGIIDFTQLKSILSAEEILSLAQMISVILDKEIVITNGNIILAVFKPDTSEVNNFSDVSFVSKNILEEIKVKYAKYFFNLEYNKTMEGVYNNVHEQLYV